MGKAIQYLKGVGPTRARQLARLGIFSLDDLVHHYPRSYLVRDTVPISQLPKHPDVSVIVSGKIIAVPRESRGRVNILTASLADETGYVRCTWFNQPFIKSKLRPGIFLSVAGKYSSQYGNVAVEEYRIDGQIAQIQAQYSLTEGISNQVMANLIDSGLAEYQDSDLFPEDFRQRYNLLSAKESLEGIHCPSSQEQIDQARYTVVFSELFLYQLSFIYWRWLKLQVPGHSLKPQPDLISRLEKSFGFRYTPDQLEVIAEIEQDLARPVPMNRLVQGDVGSGKTAVAAHALITCALNGFKAVIMVPTEVVARQHFETLRSAAQEFAIPLFLLTGSTKSSERASIDTQLACPGGGILIGTHAVFQEKVRINQLALTVTDEQHRFGVQQRLALAEKGTNPHVLVMSATPIPRTLAMTFYGDLEISTISQKPGGRKKIKTYVVSGNRRKKVFEFISREMAEGNSGYIICPLIEESESISAHSLDKYQNLLKELLPEWCKYGVLHGRMGTEEKEQTLAALKQGNIHFLLATTVVEVGVDIGDATFIVVENSERFGLAQLHQLRGRVGRREKQSYCFLVTESSEASRLKILEETDDGFAVALQDMKIRGSGQFLGNRQHGLNDFKLADIIRDEKIAKLTRAAAQVVLALLDSPDWSQVSNEVNKNISILKS